MKPLVFLSLLVSTVSAQPFETLEVGISGVATVGSAPYTDLWEPGLGLGATVETPFYLGHVALGTMASMHTAQAGTDVPDYLMFYSHASWGTHLALPGGLRLRPGLRAGLYAMRFDVDDAVAVRSESELGAGLDLALSAPLGRGWRAVASGAAIRVYTAERIDLGFLRLGLSRTFTTPGWLQGFLR